MLFRSYFLFSAIFLSFLFWLVLFTSGRLSSAFLILEGLAEDFLYCVSCPPVFHIAVSNFLIFPPPWSSFFSSVSCKIFCSLSLMTCWISFFFLPPFRLILPPHLFHLPYHFHFRPCPCCMPNPLSWAWIHMFIANWFIFTVFSYVALLHAVFTFNRILCLFSSL